MSPRRIVRPVPIEMKPCLTLMCSNCNQIVAHYYADSVIEGLGWPVRRGMRDFDWIISDGRWVRPEESKCLCEWGDFFDKPLSDKFRRRGGQFLEVHMSDGADRVYRYGMLPKRDPRRTPTVFMPPPAV